ncbi:hypothetical protein ACFVR2_21625 [Gottfriedia sp. NPDC057991]|uniref:hypothetical protein n=1 Tax=Gottfriedia sp. NPDC057991 TaxID=3346298 RepID=UPI0036D87357
MVTKMEIGGKEFKRIRDSLLAISQKSANYFLKIILGVFYRFNQSSFDLTVS